MLQLRYCPVACVRPQDLNLIPGVTDNIPGKAKDAKTQHVLSKRTACCKSVALFCYTDASRGNQPDDNGSVTK